MICTHPVEAQLTSPTGHAVKTETMTPSGYCGKSTYSFILEDHVVCLGLIPVR